MQPAFHQAAMRFGLGPRAGEPPPGDVLAWLDIQTTTDPALLAPPEGRETPATLAEGFAAWLAHDKMPPAPGQPSPVTLLLRAEQAAWIRHTLTSAEPLRDRLTTFWLNHFTVAERGGFCVAAGMTPFLREVIRPHIGGRFVDMLLATARSPAMLCYLDQVSSVGPNSAFGKRSGRGLNENLAREILELHTLSPEGGYTQADVTQFALLMTGWGVERHREPFDRVFRPNHHEPGPKTLLGRGFAEGPDAYEAALRMLGTHPATYRFVARRMVRHFVADSPPPADVAAIARVLEETGGDLGAATRAVLRLDSAWANPLSKLRSPQDWLLALHRAVGATDPRPVMAGMAALGQPLWNAPQPNGWPDTAAGWTAPEPLMQRLDLAYETAGRHARLNPMGVLDVALGPLASAETRTAVRRAGSTRDALALLFVSPEMQRR
jgi:uncharacterized protein (DUF1800 family)